MKKILFGLIVVLILSIISIDGYSQCPMCKASVESSLKNSNNKVGLGLNDGILYLLAMPYLIVGGVGLLWYKKYKKKNVDIEMGDEHINLN